MTLAELGAQLREERLALGLMVEDVAARLKVPARILRAIEDGGVGDLPHTVYTRGFIKGYGLILGYSPEKITELLNSLEDFDDDFSPPKTMEVRPLRGEGASSPVRRGLGLVLKLLVLVLLAGGGYLYYDRTFRAGDSPIGFGSPSETPAGDSATHVSPDPEWSLPDQDGVIPLFPPAENDDGVPTRTPPEDHTAETGLVPSSPESGQITVDEAAQPVSATAETRAVPSADNGTPTSAAPGTDAPAPVQNAPAATDTRTPPQTSIASDLPQDSGESARVPGTSTLPSALPAGMHQIVLTAEAECWVHANADGTVTREFNLKPGETFAMPFKTSLELKLGNAGGVRINYNGMEMPRAGSSGQVRTIRFPPQ